MSLLGKPQAVPAQARTACPGKRSWNENNVAKPEKDEGRKFSQEGTRRDDAVGPLAKQAFASPDGVVTGALSTAWVGRGEARWGGGER